MPCVHMEKSCAMLNDPRNCSLLHVDLKLSNKKQISLLKTPEHRVHRSGTGLDCSLPFSLFLTRRICNLSRF